MEDIKIFNKDKESGMRYIVEWDKGYIAPINEWKQFFNTKGYNWINFTPIKVYAEYNKFVLRYSSLEVIILGLGFYIQRSMATPEELAEFDRENAKWDAEIEAHHDMFELIKELANGEDLTITSDQRQRALACASVLADSETT